MATGLQLANGYGLAGRAQQLLAEQIAWRIAWELAHVREDAKTDSAYGRVEGIVYAKPTECPDRQANQTSAVSSPVGTVIPARVVKLVSDFWDECEEPAELSVAITKMLEDFREESMTHQMQQDLDTMFFNEDGTVDILFRSGLTVQGDTLSQATDTAFAAWNLARQSEVAQRHAQEAIDTLLHDVRTDMKPGSTVTISGYEQIVSLAEAVKADLAQV